MINAVKEKYKEFIRGLTKLGRVIRGDLFEEVTFKLRPEGLRGEYGEEKSIPGKGNHM